VFNRPQEVEELLASLTKQTFRDFEVLVIEDGSTLTAESVYERYADQLSIQYFRKPNSGPGPSRNFGFERARGDYFVLFDSDCVIPSHYLQVVEDSLRQKKLDAWGGPDRGHESFTALQQAMGFTMSSFVTTGGIRGKKAGLGNFQPRSFNMGLSKAVFLKTGGFKFDRFAEDIELSIRMREAGFRVGLIPEAFVYHKRRTTFGQFFRQVFNFGKGRVQVGRVHPGEVKLTHWFPTLFTMGLFVAVLAMIFTPNLGLVIASLYLIFVFSLVTDGLIQTRSLKVTLLSIPAAFVQLIGYGLGFLKEKLKTYI
jgi:glycosyltransferase involved in cell wall biosynthesis